MTVSDLNRVNLPDSWMVTTLGEVCHKPQYGWTTKAVMYGDGVRLLRTTDISKGHIDWTSVPVCDQNPPILSKYILRAGDIVVSRAGSVGVSALIQDCPQSVFASYLIRLRVMNGIDEEFLKYFLQSPGYWVQIAEKSSGIAQPNVNATKLSGLLVPLPPLLEQHRIVAEIERQFTRLDASVAALERVRDNLKRYRASVLRAACEGQLVPTEAELARSEGRQYEPAYEAVGRILNERRILWESQRRGRRKFKEPVTPDVPSLPDVPEGWTWATVEQMASLEPNSITDGPFGSNLKTSHYTDEGPRVIRLQNIGDGEFIDSDAHISCEHYRSLSKHRVEAGDLVIAALGQRLPRSCIIPFTVGSAIVKADCIRFKPARSVALASFLNIALNAETTRSRTASIVHGVGRPRLNQGEVKGLSLPLPPITEQRRIVADVDRRLSIIRKTESVVDASLNRADQLRQSVLKQAFTGRLVLQNPTDEPASQLLERIRAEQAEVQAAAKANRRGQRRNRRKARSRLLT